MSARRSVKVDWAELRTIVFSVAATTGNPVTSQYAPRRPVVSVLGTNADCRGPDPDRGAGRASMMPASAAAVGNGA